MRNRQHGLGMGGTLGAIALAVAMTVFGANGVRHTEAADPAIEAGVRIAAQTLVIAYNNGDYGNVFGVMTDKGFEELFFTTKEDAAADPSFFSDTVELVDVYDIEETDTGATATVAVAAGLG